MKPKEAFKALLKKALAYPGTFEDHPWDHTAVKCGNKKMFVVFGAGGGEAPDLSITCKLPQSQDAVLTMFSFAEPTGYGMGEKGWVTATFGPKDDVPADLFHEWLDESFRAVAPKRDVKLLDPGTPRPTAGRARAAPSRARQRG